MIGHAERWIDVVPDCGAVAKSWRADINHYSKETTMNLEIPFNRQRLAVVHRKRYFKIKS